MSFAGHHIAFPRTFLALNTTPKKSVVNAGQLSPSSEPQLPPHGFLSNRPSASIARHSSISSVSSVDSNVSTASTRASSEAPSPPFDKQTLHTFLSLNSMYVAPATPAASLKAVDANGFLSNRG
ncbi:hypothetical protein DM02DRAFT_621541 [Periconia macrospinosa]|uniref:Uncharacterized protein n=1 Tax=Periconia macrospinosa TaxID=97972 RepID=A0A2V1EDP7_9PLEO|nr:hypothetical protein DM02DRAFT_621541 [Periconia macrospinosa]